MTTNVDCPSCGKSIPWSTDNPWRPFCCERCKLIDFGEWASESHKIAGESVYGDAGMSEPDKDQ
ncbi:MAG: DNA gyrase inhibitor YacG [Thiohalomonadales bacterium]